MHASNSGSNSTMKSLKHPLEAVAEIPDERSNDTNMADIPRRRRKDSGYAEELRRPNYKSKSEDAGIDILQLQASLIEIANTNSTSPPRSAASPSAPTSPASSLHARSRNSSNLTTTTLPISIQECYLSHQKAQDIIRTTEVYDLTTRTTRTPTSIQSSSSRTPSITSSQGCSIRQSDSHQDIQSSPWHTATNIDWTNPTTRQKMYEMHDRNNRGIRRLIKKVTPKRWQRGRLDFYDGNSDAGSVRRYRLDI